MTTDSSLLARPVVTAPSAVTRSRRKRAPVLMALASVCSFAVVASAHEGHTHDAAPQQTGSTPPPSTQAHDHAAAAGPSAHEEHPSPHGGQVVVLDKAEHVHAELVFRDTGLAVYLYDKDMKPLPAPSGAKVTLLVGKEVRKLELVVDAAMPDHVSASTSLPSDAKVIAVVSVTMKGKASSARVERLASGTALPEHDHRSVHGGVVRMSGDDHIELVAEPEGTYRVWYTDAFRRPLKDGTSGTLTVTSKDKGPETIALSPGKDDALVGTGTTRSEARTVLLEGKAHGFPVKTQWDVVGVVNVGSEPIDLEVTDAGFVPADLRVRAGQKVTLRVTRRTEATCATAIVVPGYVEQTALPLGKAVEISFTPKKTGSIRYGCAMGEMIGGVILVQQ